MSTSRDQTDEPQAIAVTELDTLARFLSDNPAHQLSELQAIRQAKADALRSRGEEPYPTRTTRDTTVEQARLRFIEVEPTWAEGARDEAPQILAGRLVARRHQGKTVFAQLRDGTGEIQLYLRRDDIGQEAFEDFLKLYDLGDFVEVEGTLFRTRAGEVSLHVARFAILSKALNAPPEKWHGLQDVETRYRQRYADLISNADVRDVFEKRSRIIRAIRNFLDARGFIEVETPTLQPLYGGAAAGRSRPSTTPWARRSICALRTSST